MKTIGILNNVFQTTIGQSQPYVEFFKQFGKVVTIDWDDDDVRKVDLLVLPGGADVDTFRYNQMPHLRTGQPNIYFEWFDRMILPKYIQAGIPVFGVCRGMQTLNVLFGGTLYQHIYTEYSEKSRGELVHAVKPDRDNKDCLEFLKNIGVKIENFKVNSLHHQNVNKLGDGFMSLFEHANAKDTLVEAMVHTKLPIAAVQWHPEEIYSDDKLTYQLIDYLLEGTFNTKDTIAEYEFIAQA